jgi:DNA repair protein RadA/Sms
MAKAREKVTTYRCAECGWQTQKWVGRCGECQAWGTLEEAGAARLPTTIAGPVATPALPINDVDVEAARADSTGVPELDRVLGGGLVRGAVVLVAGEPGVGKSTLLLEVAAERAKGGGRCLYISGEESAAQVRLRAERVDALQPELFLAAETELSAVLGHIDHVKPDLLVLDSVQTVASAQIDGSPGGVTQVREVASSLIRVSKERGIATLIVGHVTKDGSIAGPRMLEHLVDVVLSFEGDQQSRLRMVRSVKNRFGPTDEVGCFDFADGGLVGLPDPSGLFLTRRPEPVSGSCVTVTVEGKRPLLAEVQGLVVESHLGTPRRATSGLESSRVAMVLAVLERRGAVSLAKQDVYAATVGGVRIKEPAADLAIALAVASATADLPLPSRLVAIGEVGLAGDLRRVTAIRHRLAEAVRLGFTHALVPPDAGPPPAGIHVKEASSLATALRAALELGSASQRQ